MPLVDRSAWCLIELQKFWNSEKRMQTLSSKYIKVQAKGVITIPRKLRKRTGLADNSLARIREEKGKIIIEPVRVLPYPVRSYTQKEVAEFFSLDEKTS